MNLRAILSLLCLLSPAAAQDKKPDPPAAAEQAEAEKLIKEVFKEEYAKRTPGDRLALARQMLAQAAQTKDDPKSQFVLLREARDLAALAGDAATGFAAVDEMAKYFAINASAMKNAILGGVAKAARTPEDFKTVAALALKMVDGALLGDDYDSAEKFAASALLNAKRAQDVPLANRVAARTREIADLKARHEKIRKAREALAANPEDEAANLTVGLFYCMTKSDWERGLAHLSKGADAALKALAQKDLAKPADPPGQIAVGDGWWDLGEKETGPSKDHLKDHAAQWYVKGVAKLTGLNKTRIEKRLADHQVARLFRGPWTDYSEPKLFGQGGKTGDPVKLAPDPGFLLNCRMQLPKGDFDGVSVRVTLDPAKAAMGWLMYEPPKSAGVFVDSTRGIFANARYNVKTWDHVFQVPWQQQQEALLTVLLVDGEYIVYLNAREMTRAKTMNSKLTYVGFEAWEGPVKFDQIQLRRIE